MRHHSLSRRGILTGALAAPFLLRPGAARALEPVDVELVLAVDVSRSVDQLGRNCSSAATPPLSATKS